MTVKHDGRSVKTFVVHPERKDKAPVIVVIHEIFGMSDWVQEAADECAAAGYIAIAPDLLSGMAPPGGRTSDFAAGGHGQAICDGLLLGRRPDVSLLNELERRSSRYGICGPPPAKDAIAKITAPVYGFYGGNGARINATIPDTTEQMKAASKTYEPTIYEDAGDGIMRAGEQPDATEANKKARDEAWTRLKAIMK